MAWWVIFICCIIVAVLQLCSALFKKSALVIAVVFLHVAAFITLFFLGIELGQLLIIAAISVAVNLIFNKFIAGRKK